VADSMLNWVLAWFFCVGISAMSANANDCIRPCQIKRKQVAEQHLRPQQPQAVSERLQPAA
jgi:hypothetical protein